MRHIFAVGEFFFLDIMSWALKQLALVETKFIDLFFSLFLF